MSLDDEYRFDAFVSYSHDDKKWVREKLVPALEKFGAKINIDYKNFSVGSFVSKEIEKSILQSRKTIVILSPSYVKSPWTEFENLLIQTLDPSAKQKRLIPILLKPCDAPIRIASLYYLDFTKDEIFEENIAKLGKAIVNDTCDVLEDPKSKRLSEAEFYILHVDNDPNFQKMLKRQLRNESFSIETASNFSEALTKIIKSSIWNPDIHLALCVIDLNLNDGYDEYNWDGIGLLALCKLLEIPTIVLSGFINKQRESKLMTQFGAGAVLRKEKFHKEDIIDAIKRLVK